MEHRTWNMKLEVWKNKRKRIRSKFYVRCSINRGNSLVEMMLAIGLAFVFLPAIITGYVVSREGKAQQNQRVEAIAYVKEMQEAVRSIREIGWTSIATNGTYHTAVSGNAWSLVSGTQTTSGFTQSVVISDVYRDASGNIVTTGGTIDTSTKKVVLTVSWSTPFASSVSSTSYMTRYLNNTVFTQTTQTDFSLGTLFQTQVTNTSGGEVTLANNNKAKWCSPAFSTNSIDLPDGPPVAVVATASASISTPNDVFVATAPNTASSIKMAYVNVSADVVPPVPTLRGTFTLDSTKYSAGTYPASPGIDNSFKTNDIKYYKSTGGKLYVLMATDKPDREVVVVQINNGTTDSFQDPVNKIYKYWTFFNTRIYEGNSASTPNQDRAPYGYGAVSLTIIGDTGYTISGGFLYAFDLSNIDSKTPSVGLDMVGCRIELDGYDCKAGGFFGGTLAKYSAGQTGAAWGNTSTPVNSDCSDGGNIELHAENDIYGVQVGANKYIYSAIGAGTNPELNIANVSTIPTASTTPSISNSSCGISGAGNTNTGWKRIGSLDFNTKSNTEEAANSVYAKSDGSRAYISSNGGIDGNGDGLPDSYQWYVVDTTDKTNPHFLSTSSSGNGSIATSGYYYGVLPNRQLFPRRSLTVLNGLRAVLVGKDGFSDSNNAQEYQVLDITSETSPNYCGGVDFNSGFNDLTSVSEADGDNFVYMVTNTATNQLRIIEGGPDAGYFFNSGTFESSAYDASFSAAFNRFTATVSTPSATTIKMQVAVAPPVSGSCSASTFSYVGPNASASAYFTPVSGVISGTIPVGTYGSYGNPNRCFRYKTFLDTTDTNNTPVLNDVTVNYVP